MDHISIILCSFHSCFLTLFFFFIVLLLFPFMLIRFCQSTFCGRLWFSLPVLNSLYASCKKRETRCYSVALQNNKPQPWTNLVQTITKYMHIFLHLPGRRIGSCLAYVYRVMDARGKFGGHERSVRVAQGVAESNSSFLSALQTSQVHP